MRCRVKTTTRLSAAAAKKPETKPLEMSDDSVGYKAEVGRRDRVMPGVKMMTWICLISVVYG